MAISTSVLTLVRGRQQHLDNLIKGLVEQRISPTELVVASMQDETPEVPDNTPFPITITHVAGSHLPLAAARNRAASLAIGEHLVFLDVDCIPSPTLVQRYNEELRGSDLCLMGEVRYLPTFEAPGRGIFDTLLPYAQRHPARPAAPDRGCRIEPKVRGLWGLSFAIRRTSFERAGGFDEDFVGYGGEETDFAERLNRHGVPLAWCAQAMALHQQHRVYSPPLKSFDDIIGNATVFFDKWGSWCMEYWLDQFSAMGLIDWNENATCILVRRRPNENEISYALRPESARWG